MGDTQLPKPKAMPSLSFEPIGAAKVSVDARCIMVGDIRLENDDALRLAQTLIEARIWQQFQRNYHYGDSWI